VNGTNHLIRLNSDGSYDSTFYSGFNGSSVDAHGGVTSVIVCKDESLYVGGDLTFYNSLPGYVALVHLTPSGALDRGFTSPFAPGTSVRCLALLPDEKLLVGGSLRSGGFPGNAAGLARLKQDGSLDTTFRPLTNSTLRALLVQGDKYIVGGDISFDGDLARRGLARINGDGTPDLSFSPQTDGQVEYILGLPDGKFVISGPFTRVNGERRVMMARLNADGSLDSSFDVGGGFDGNPSGIALQPDGKLLVQGSFYRVNGVPAQWLTRLVAESHPGELRFSTATFETMEGGALVIQVDRVGGSDGPLEARIRSEDLSAVAGVNYAPIDTIIRFEDSDILRKTVTIQTEHIPDLTGNRTLEVHLVVGSNDTMARALIRDAELGRVDPNLVLHLEPAAATIKAFDFFSDGSLLLGGDFTAINGVAAPYAARVRADGTVETSFLQGFAPNNTVLAALVGPGDEAFIGGMFSQAGAVATRFVARINPDGTIDPSFSANAAKARFNSAETLLAAQPAGRIFVQYLTGSLRLYADGTSDPLPSGSFKAPVLPMLDGSLLAGGSSVRHYLPDLTPDGAFTTVAVTLPEIVVPPQAIALAATREGNFLMGGNFTRVNGIARSRLARIASTGALDLSFNPVSIGAIHGTSDQVSAVLQLPDGDILIGGNFLTVQDQTRTHLAQLDSAGKLRPQFAWDIQGDLITRLATAPSGAIYVLGSITNIDGTPVPGFARILNRTNEPPVTEISSPLNNTSIGIGSGLTVHIRAFDPDGFLSQVTLLVNGSSAATLTSAPYDFELSNLAEGKVTLSAEATDLSGATTLSSPIVITVAAQSEPVTLNSPTIDADGKLRLSFTGRTGNSYRLETSEDLVLWTQAETRTPADSNVEFSVDYHEKTHRFYRVVQE
jgi:uncharacterized delta-60 repeat protein